MRRLLVALPALVAFAVYLGTLNPTTPAGDSGELIAAAHTLGVAHPPGYPLYVLLGHLWTRALPLGSAAFELNLFSAVCAALTVWLVARLVRTLTGSLPAAAAAGLFLAFHAPFWKYAVVAEVFALNALLAVLALTALARFLEETRPAGRGSARARGTRHAEPRPEPAAPRPGASLFALGALSTLLLAHHHTLVLLMLPVWVLVLLPRLVRAGTRRRWLVLLSGVAAGLLPLLHVPLAASHNPALNWGDARTWDRFVRLLTRAEYGTFRLDPESAGLTADRSHILLFAQSLARDFTWIGVVLLACGLIALARRRRDLLVPVVGFLGMQALFFTRVNFPTEPPVFLGVVERFYILPAVVLAVVLGFGAAEAVRFTAARSPGAARALGAALVLAAAWPFAAHFAHADQRGNTFTADLVHNVLASLPERAVLFSQGDIFHNGLAAAQLTEGARRDVTVIDQELLTRSWYAAVLRRRDPGLLPTLGPEDRYDGTPETGTLRWFDHLAGRRPAAVLGLKEETYAERYVLGAHGFILLAHPKDRAPSLREQAEAALALFPRFRLDAWFRAYDPWSFEMTERWRFTEIAARTALLLCREECFDLTPESAPGFAALVTFVDRHRNVPDPDPELLRAGGLLRAVHPAVRDAAVARDDLARYLAMVPAGRAADEVRRVLASITPPR